MALLEARGALGTKDQARSQRRSVCCGQPPDIPEVELQECLGHAVVPSWHHQQSRRPLDASRIIVPVQEAGSRGRDLPAPVHVVFEALTEPNRDPARKWLVLLDDEIAPEIVEAGPSRVVWASIWPSRPDARIEFQLTASSGTFLRWTLLLEDPMPDASKLGHLRKRINELINANLRYSFGQ